MTDTTTEAEQRAEWLALHERMGALHDSWQDALRQAGDFIRFGIEHGDEEECLRLARKSAQDAINARNEREALQEQVDAHPYTATMKARAS